MLREALVFDAILEIAVETLLPCLWREQMKEVHKEGKEGRRRGGEGRGGRELTSWPLFYHMINRQLHTFGCNLGIIA